MHEILKQMRKELKPLITLINRVNKHIEQANENGYEIRTVCYGSSSNTIHGIRLSKFRKDFIEPQGKNIAPKAIKSILERITVELTRLGSEDYHVIINTASSNDYDVLNMKEAYMILYKRDLKDLQ